MWSDKSIKQGFGANLAQLLWAKIFAVYPAFDLDQYIDIVDQNCEYMSYSQRILLHAHTLHQLLPSQYLDAIQILSQVLGPENPNETWMFKTYYRIMPIGKFVELYGLEHPKESLDIIAEITKRNTGEYAIRPFLRIYPDQTIKIMKAWATSSNFHLRRLASEWSRPKLPRSQKLDTFIDHPEPVFQILEILMQDSVKFVQKSVANNITDYLKVHKQAAIDFITRFAWSDNKHTQWILKHATRKIKI